jgi:hypothetical protein
MKKVTKKIKKIRFPAQGYPPNADFQASARSSTTAFRFNAESPECRRQ